MVILLSFFVFSCSPKKEEVIPEKNAQVLINKAKNWFKNQQKASSRLKSMDTTKIVYDWSKASWQKHYQMDFVEVPILYNGNYLSADLTTTQNNKVLNTSEIFNLWLKYT